MKRALVALMVMAAAACSKTDDGRVVVETPGDVDVTTRKDTLSLPRVNMPDVDIGTKKDTVIVNRPTITKRDTTRP